jgi:hypothetical protein
VTVEPGGQIEADGASHDRELGIDACTMALALDRVPDPAAGQPWPGLPQTRPTAAPGVSG